MTSALKDSFGPEVPRRIAAMVSSVHPRFPTERFMADSLDGLDALELMDRVAHVGHALRRHLPADYPEALRILTASLGPAMDGEELNGMEAFVYAPHGYLVGEYGLDHWEPSMDFQYRLTQRFSAEFSIRPYLEREPTRTLERLREWATDPSPHVRRLVSEGTRPRLPWARRLREFQRDPTPVLALLELLKDDPALYVRRSVANNLNDIGKDHPEALIVTCRRWLQDANPARRWLVRHALRSAVKRADPQALALLGYSPLVSVTIDAFSILPARPRIGEHVVIALTARNAGSESADVNIDLRIRFVRGRGESAKVFKGRAVQLGPGEVAEVRKVVSLAQHSTRTHYPGMHAVDALINGVPHDLGAFQIDGG